MPPRFEDRFADELAAFRAEITGPEGAADHASVLVHRLMFVRFLQQGGFLPGLANGNGRCFYRQTLLPFFHAKLPRVLGIDPFRSCPALDEANVADPACRRLLAFFDAYSWCLNGETCNQSTTVTPQVLGTLFEQHVNRKATGTYYTPDDVTDFIARSTIVPCVLRDVLDRSDSPDKPASAVWQLLRSKPDRYIPAAVRCRQCLLTETRTEHLDRRARYRNLLRQLRAGRVRSVNDLVTLNLDSPTLACDAAGVPALQPACARSLETIAVLDPTCGSGAFLFAALRILEELRIACGHRPGFALRAAIIQRNLHGLDLMPEAVELCRLRLMLELLAEKSEGRHRLADLSCTIRIGDALTGFDWGSAFPAPMRRGGFDVVIGNPPYLPARRRTGNSGDGSPANLATAACPDVYAWVLERSASLVRPGGWCGMIVPLSLAFSQDFEACRRLLFSQYGSNWFAHFARIPSALFAGDVRVRNTIHIGYKSTAPGAQHTTRLHRWFEAARPGLFQTLTFVPFRPEPWQYRVPKLGSSALLAALAARLDATPARLGDSLAARPTPYRLHFKKTAYNWLTFCKQQPPCYDARGKKIAHTQFDTLYFKDAATRDRAFLFLNGKWAYAFWCAVGDDFHVTRSSVADFPIDLTRISPTAAPRLRPLAQRLERAMKEATSFKQNAGKRVGTYNLARCRSVTDHSDRIFAECLELEAWWPQLELLCKQMIKTDFGATAIDRAPFKPVS
jgi:hypothetical protein